MTQQQLIMAISRIERALFRIEQAPLRSPAEQSDTELFARYERLKVETRAAIGEIDAILKAGTN